jgi:hypothetical protein
LFTSLRPSKPYFTLIFTSLGKYFSNQPKFEAI